MLCAREEHNNTPPPVSLCEKKTHDMKREQGTVNEKKNTQVGGERQIEKSTVPREIRVQRHERDVRCRLDIIGGCL